MRLAVLAGIIALNCVWAADPFAGDWKLNPAKSEFKDKVKAGRVLIEADNAGGYRQLYEIIFDAAPPVRLTSRSQFDGTAEETNLDGQDVRYTSRRIDANAFEITYRDSDTNRVNRTVRFSAEPHDHTLTVLTTDARAVFDRLGEGPLLEPGKSIEQTFGPGAVYEYRIRLQAGEYCAGKIEPKEGGVNGAFYGPDGARLYNLGGPAAESRSFRAGGAGRRHLQDRPAVRDGGGQELHPQRGIHHPSREARARGAGEPAQGEVPQPAHRRFAKGRGGWKSRCGGGLLARDRKGRRADFRASRRQRPRYAGDVPVARHAFHAQCDDPVGTLRDGEARRLSDGEHRGHRRLVSHAGDPPWRALRLSTLPQRSAGIRSGLRSSARGYRAGRSAESPQVARWPVQHEIRI